MMKEAVNGFATKPPAYPMKNRSAKTLPILTGHDRYETQKARQ